MINSLQFYVLFPPLLRNSSIVKCIAFISEEKGWLPFRFFAVVVVQSTRLILEELLRAKLRQMAAMKAWRCPALAHTGQREGGGKETRGILCCWIWRREGWSDEGIMMADSITHRAFLEGFVGKSKRGFETSELKLRRVFRSGKNLGVLVKVTPGHQSRNGFLLEETRWKASLKKETPSMAN